MIRTRSGILAALAGGALLAACPRVVAQPSPGLCWRARPQPFCGAFVLTNAAMDALLSGRRFADNTAIRASADWGLMLNTGAWAAAGASLFVRLEKGLTVAAGPALRYRRWTGAGRSLDFAIGGILLSSDERGSVFGLVKYNLSDWAGITLRPELARALGPTCGGSTCPSTARITVGLELGWLPGALLTLLGGGAAAGASSVRLGP